MYLIQMLLPRFGPDGGPLENVLFGKTREELIEVFHGVTAYLRSPAQGDWTSSDGRVERDEMLMVEVLAETFDRSWWQAYAEKLNARFRQEEIHVRALPAETLNTREGR